MENQKGWQNSIRHNLSLNKAFVRHKERDDGGRKGGNWSINPSFNVGSFKRVKKSDLDDSFWEPDESAFDNSPHVQPNIPRLDKQDLITLINAEQANKAQVQDGRTMSDSDVSGDSSDSDAENDQTSINDDSTSRSTSKSRPKIQLSGLDKFRRKSVEDFLEMDKAILESSPRGPKHGKRRSRHKRNEVRLQRKLIIGQTDADCHDLLVPLPPLSASTLTERSLSSSISSSCKETQNDDKTLLNLDLQSHKLPFEGSMDYWEQYDPDFVRKHGVAVITSNEDELPVCVEALCFLCGSEG